VLHGDAANRSREHRRWAKKNDMHDAARKVCSLLIAVAVAGIVGAVLGIIGVAVEVHNVSLHGASYSNYTADFLAVPALPGECWVEHRLGYDLQLGEIASYRWQAAGWNGLFYVAAVGIVWGFCLLVYRSKPPNRVGGGG
jgi:H+/Cl- antiporter ClcA